MTKVTLSLHHPVQDAPDLERRTGGMHGNFDPTANLDGSGGATVTGWVAWDGNNPEPSECHVRVEVKQTSGHGSAKATGESGTYHQAPNHVTWSAPAANTGNDDLRAGAAYVKAWIEDATHHVYFQWDTTVTLV